LIGCHEGGIYYQWNLSFTLGQGSELNPAGLEHTLHNFKNHERRVFQLKPSYAFGSAGNEAFSISPEAEVKYKIKLKNFEKVKEA
jgi:FK506-binding protein 4/5